MHTTKRITILAAAFVLLMSACSTVTDLLGSEPDPTATVVVEAPTEVPTVAPAPTEATDASSDADDSGDATTSEEGTYVFSQAESQARFRIWEVLFGADTEVVGVTNVVDGSITVDLADPQSVSVSTVTVDLTGITTDNGSRNGQIHRSILHTGQFPTATFEPTGYANVPASVAVGDTFNFQIQGNLTIHGNTLPATFDVTATVESADRISGLASLVIEYAEWGVQILQLPPQVASAASETTLELQFVATK